VLHLIALDAGMALIAIGDIVAAAYGSVDLNASAALAHPIFMKAGRGLLHLAAAGKEDRAHEQNA
jgi:hypothetical protein